MAVKRFLSLCMLASTMALTGCEQAPQQLTLNFSALAAGTPLNCQGQYQAGRDSTPFTLRDLRFFVSDVALINSNGDAVPVQLTADGKWQYGSVALLDFENASDHCAGNSGNPDTNHQVIGTLPAGDYHGVVFSLGVPPEYNHLGETAVVGKSPLKTNGMKWSWATGHKFARFDIAPQGGVDYTGLDGNPARSRVWAFHLGATNCEGDLKTETSHCTHPNLPRIQLDNFNPATDSIALDYPQLVHGLTLNTDQGGRMGCMSGQDDPECKVMFQALGLTLATGQMTQPPSLFQAHQPQ